MKHEVAIIERLKCVTEIEAENQEEALRIAQQMYDNEEIKLDYRDYDGYKILITEDDCFPSD